MPSLTINNCVERLRDEEPPSAEALAASILVLMKQFARLHPDKQLPRVMREVEKQWT